MKYYIALLALFFTSEAVAQPEEMTPIDKMPSGVYTQEESHTSLNWKVNHLGLSEYTARFTKVQIDLVFDALAPTNSTVEARIDPLSIKTDYPKPEEKDFDATLAKGKEWFNATQHPFILFKSTKVEVTGEKTGKVYGDLTLLGVTKPVTLDVTFNGAYAKMPYMGGAAMGFSASTTIKRSEWGFSSYIPNIGDEVTIMIEAELHKKEQ